MTNYTTNTRFLVKPSLNKLEACNEIVNNHSIRVVMKDISNPKSTPEWPKAKVNEQV
jgi:hypothetical protein